MLDGRKTLRGKLTRLNELTHLTQSPVLQIYLTVLHVSVRSTDKHKRHNICDWICAVSRSTDSLKLCTYTHSTSDCDTPIFAQLTLSVLCAIGLHIPCFVVCNVVNKSINHLSCDI